MAYGYDAANQLTGINYLSPTNTAMGALTYGYDLDGRRISKTGSFATDVLPAVTTAAGSFDANNRQTQFNGTPQTYDANGNLTSNGVDTFVWNARNQLTQINAGSTTQFSYAYDALGRRTSKSVAGASAPTTYLYDGMNAVQEAVGSTTNPILTGLSIDERFARNDVNGRTDLLTDALNSTIALTNATGAIKQQYSYDPYGNVTQNDTTTGFTNPYLYAGREADSTGLYYYRARYYSPTMGRFISEDPIGFDGGQNNFYAYVGNSPLDFSDPLGLTGFGLNGGGSAQGGVINGGAMQASTGVGVFWGDGLNVGGYTASGSFAGHGNFDYHLPGAQGDSAYDPDNGYSTMAIGASAGLGLGVWGTNANNAEQLLGAFDTSTLNVGFITAQWAEDASGTYTWSFGFAKGLGFDFNRYQVVTTAAGTFYRRRKSPCN